MGPGCLSYLMYKGLLYVFQRSRRNVYRLANLALYHLANAIDKKQADYNSGTYYIT